MAIAVYILCAVTSLACAVLLFRGYRRSGGAARFLLWSSLCFAALAVNNAILFVDRVVLPDVPSVMGIDFAVLRSGVAIVGVSLLIYGLIWDAE